MSPEKASVPENTGLSASANQMRSSGAMAASNILLVDLRTGFEYARTFGLMCRGTMLKT